MGHICPTSVHNFWLKRFGAERRVWEGGSEEAGEDSPGGGGVEGAVEDGTSGGFSRGLSPT